MVQLCGLYSTHPTLRPKNVTPDPAGAQERRCRGDVPKQGAPQSPC